jgi:tRNA-2-methylthio-N6-dimethylallyladenosine synthase
MYTIGCQMNVYDSEQISLQLASLGYQQTAMLDMADLVIVNTCSVRAKAEQKAYSFMGRLARLKINKPGLIIGVGGCVAQQEGQKLLRRVPHLDLVFGTRAIDRLPLLIQKITDQRCRLVDVSLTEKPNPSAALPGSRHDGPVSRFVTIMRGCDNFCTYCVVPYVRGRETSRHPNCILEEIKGLVDSGAREVTLLGQNVNSYGKKEGLCSFAELLARVQTIEGLWRIRFTTSHPKDLGRDLIQAFKIHQKVCDHIHLPVQSGSDRILKKMKRNYSSQLYLDKVNHLRDTCPDIAITSDIVVGFPGETGADFDETLNLMQTVKFDGLFAFSYSDRPHAPAAQFKHKVSEQQKRKRLQMLLKLQEKYTKRKNSELVGSSQQVLVEGFSKKRISVSLDDSRQPDQLMGRTSTNKIVNFDGNANASVRDHSLIGQIVPVKIERACAHSLWGRSAAIDSTTEGLKGDKFYAA